MGALSKIEIANELASEQSEFLNKREAKVLVEMFYEEIALALEAGEEVKLSGLGRFFTIDKNPRPGRNPKTGEDALISARRVVAFKSGQLLKETVARETGSE